MYNMWILASADGEGEVITSEPAAQTEQVTTTQADGTSGAQTEGETPQRPPGSNMLLWIMLPVLLVYMFMMFRGPKKKQQQHKEMVSSLAKNARIRTIGGIFGTVLDVRDDEIVIKIDESTNTKMRISPSAVATVIKDAKSE